MIRMNQKTLAAVCGAALAASLGLSACGGTTVDDTAAQQSETTEEATTTDAAAEDIATDTGSTLAQYGFTQLWMGMGVSDESMAYLFENADETQGAYLIYYTIDNTYERFVGALGKPQDNQVQITDDETGASVTLTIAETDEDGTLTIERPDGNTSRITPSEMEYAGDVLDSISSYASKVGEAPAPTASDLYDYLVKIHTEGMGQVAFTQSTFGDESMNLDTFGDDAATHANEGDTLTILAKPDEGHEFLKWTKDGADFSTDAQIEVTVDGDAEYTAVFDY